MSALFCPGSLGEYVRSKLTVSFVAVLHEIKSFWKSNPSTSHSQEEQQVLQEVWSVHQPDAEINKRWDFSDGVVSGGRTLCLSPEH